MGIGVPNPGKQKDPLIYHFPIGLVDRELRNLSIAFGLLPLLAEFTALFWGINDRDTDKGRFLNINLTCILNHFYQSAWEVVDRETQLKIVWLISLAKGSEVCSPWWRDLER